MDRVRESRRTGVPGGGPPPPRRRLRSNGGGGGGPRDSPRSERRRGERLMLNGGGGGGGGGRDDGDETSDESLGDDDDDADEELPASATRYPPVQRRSPSTAQPPSPPQPGGGHHHSSSSSGGGGGGGGYHNHHHHGGQQQIRKGGSNPKSPIVWKAADEMIGVPVPRKARSASTKRSSHEWSVHGGGGGGGGSGVSGAGDSSQIQRPPSRPISPASGSTTGPARKKSKQVAGGGGVSGQAPKHRPAPPSSAPPAAPPQPLPPPKISKSPSFIQEEIEVAEVLFGLRQFPGPPKPVENNHKLELRDASEAKSGNSSPAPASSAARPLDTTSHAAIAPKRKRPRLVKYEDDNRPASPSKPELAEPSSRLEVLPASRSEAKASTVLVATESGTTTTAGAQHEASREPEKRDDHKSRDSELRAGESDHRDHRTESRPEPPLQPPPSGKPEGESAAVVSEPRNGEATTATKIELASDGPRQEKFCIDLMAPPPPGKLSPDRDGSSDPDAGKKGLDSETDMVRRGNSEKKDGERTRRGLEIDLEDEKVQRIPAEELAPKKLTLQLDLEKPSVGEEKSPSERRPHPTLQQQQQKSSKNETKHEKSGKDFALIFAKLVFWGVFFWKGGFFLILNSSYLAAMPAVTPPMPIPVGSWLGSFPPFGYLGPVPGLSAAGLHHPMDVKPGSSAGLQHAALLPPPPVRPKRCATHCFIAQQIQYNQRIAKMNSFWPPAAAAAAAASRSGPFFGPRPFNMGVVPPVEAASLLVNPMQGSYPVRAHAPLQESKAPSMATPSFQGTLSKEKAALNNAAVAESSQRKQPPGHEAQQSSPVPTMLQGPAFIFPFNQQHAAAVAAANAANRVDDTKPSGGSNAMQPSATAHTSAANPGAAAMNLSFTNLQPADAQFLAILQNGGYTFPVAAHAGGPPSYRGMAPPGPAVPFFNGHVYSPHMLHPSQQQGAPPQNLQKAPMSSLPTSSQKHQSQQSQGLLGYAPNANAAANNNSQSYSSGNQRPVLLPGLSHRHDSEKTVQDGPSSDDKSPHPQKGSYDHNYAVPVHLPNFALMPPNSAANGQSDKKPSEHHLQQLPPASRGQGVRIDLASSQPFVLPFGSVGAPGSAPSGLDFSSLAQNHALFHQEAGRHGYPQLNFATAQSVQAAQHKSQHHQVTGETKSLAGDSSTHNTVDSERKKSATARYPGDSQQHSLSFSRQENKSYVPPFLSGSTNESSSRTMSLIGSESSNAFTVGGKSASALAPAATSAAAPSPSTIPQQQQQQQQQQQHFLQLHKQQQLMQHHHLNSRPRSAAPSNTGGYSDRMNMANFQGMMYPSSATQGGVPSQSPQLKASSARATGAPAGVTSPGAPPSNLIVMKNSGAHQQQAKAPLQSLSTSNHHPQSSLNMSSSKLGPSVTNISAGGGDLSRSSNAPVASGSPSNSVSKSTGASPPASGSAKGVPPAIQLPSSQQQSAKNPASTSGAKSTPTNHYSSMPMPSILGQQPNVQLASNSGSKQQSHMPSLKQQPFQQGHFFISNAYTPQAPGGTGGVGLGLYQKRPAEKTQPQVPHQQSAMSAAAGNNMKTHHPPSGGFMHLTAASQSPSGVPHSHMSAAQLTFGSMPVSVKPSDQKPAAGK
ncbi:hypothetical protein GUJ93_ZPchr0013g35808 [Zizania palustris]|uniref:Protein TIME FOR COFFEE n=1 Tax=Zizania palustris TaxID=103762 RepID=A0A8J5X438_ZIZPA|nr:hypothetical protein GUJ93_ZPchr0013g35808 [Zizania palustris]